MTEKERIKYIVNEIPVPTLLVGSGVMVMHDIDRELGDLDLFVATRNWFRLYDHGLTRNSWQLVTPGSSNPETRCDPPYLEATIKGLVVNVFFSWRTRENGKGNMDASQRWLESEVIEGVRCATLLSLLSWKMQVMRPKDWPDVGMLLDHMAKTNGRE